MMFRLSLRARFALLYLGGVLPLLFLLGILIYMEYFSFLREEYSANMRALVYAVTAPPASPDTPSVPYTLSRLGTQLVRQLEGTDFAAITLDIDGQPLAASLAAGDWLPAAQEAARTHYASGASESAHVTLSTPQGARLAYVLPVVAPDGAAIGTIITSFPDHIIINELQQPLLWLFLTITGLALLSLLMIPVLANAAARPVYGLVATAQRVAEGDLAQRAPRSNVDELQTLTETFNTMLDRLQLTLQAEKATTVTMRRFAADAAHELRSPLAVLRSGIDVWQMSQQRQDTSGAQQAAELVEAEIERMNRLVDNLLLIARIEDANEQTTYPINLTEVDALPLLEEVAERAQMLSKGQILRLEWPQAALAPLRADVDLLRRALNNLVENALRHTPPGHTITLEVAPTQDGCNFIVNDQGCGIEAEHLPNLFNRFYRIDGVRTRQGSTGLGLSIVQAIAAAHGGRIQITSEVGRGTTATLWLPTMPPPTAHLLSPPSSGAHVETAAPPYDHGRSRTASARLRRMAPAIAGVTGLIAVAIIIGGRLLLPGAMQSLRPEDELIPFSYPETITALAPVREAPDSAALAPVTSQPAPVTASVATLQTITDTQPATATPAFSAAPNPFDVADALARTVMAPDSQIVSIEWDEEDGLYEVTFTDRTEVTVETTTLTVLSFSPNTGADRGRGTQQRSVQQARLATLLAQEMRLLTFGAVAEIARAATGIAQLPVEVEITWDEQRDRLYFEAEFADGSTVSLDPVSGEILARE